ncbi:MAG: ABC transporter permease [Phycisphaerales bacterium]
MSAINQSTPDEVQSDVLTSRKARRGTSPAVVAIAHLKQRKIAMVCFGILVFYFLLAAVTFLRLPDSTVTNADGSTQVIERRFIGEWFEELATKRLLDEDGNPLDYHPPGFGQPTRAELDGEKRIPTTVYWETPAGEPRTLAANYHLMLGTDIQGRSVFWRTLYGARMSLSIAFWAAVLSIVIGTVLGALAGYFGGWVDITITWLFTTVASIPRILLILALAYSLKGQTIHPLGVEVNLSGSLMLIMAMGLTSWVGLCRLIRGEILKQKEMDYESAARALGVGRGRILVRHLLPNAFYLVIIQFSLLFPLFIHLEVILSYLGLGASSGVSWGQMIEASLLEMMKSPIVWWQLAAASVAVFGVSLALNLFGDALRDALDPRLQASN